MKAWVTGVRAVGDGPSDRLTVAGSNAVSDSNARTKGARAILCIDGVSMFGLLNDRDVTSGARTQARERQSGTVSDEELAPVIGAPFDAIDHVRCNRRRAGFAVGATSCSAAGNGAERHGGGRD